MWATSGNDTALEGLLWSEQIGCEPKVAHVGNNIVATFGNFGIAMANLAPKSGKRE